MEAQPGRPLETIKQNPPGFRLEWGWEEKSLNKWATDRIKELLVSMRSLDFFGGQAEVSEVTKCSGINNF
ncbi:uncharacterized protein LOC111399806 isoform X2 [Olea europaea subsp. europaea]|uniref:Uncharacterized protein LOC111399806 isoform X2 n=1 Tax=Olea europaea subsp. europaea TaxID=158383 RepID=A0A8S0U5U4_OLEEU|nr:uncharacterized protein LOC111399806 isoform X2 [Olea europaea subsp. europaea]